MLHCILFIYLFLCVIPRVIPRQWPYKGESAALGRISVSIFFGQVDNKESKKI